MLARIVRGNQAKSDNGENGGKQKDTEDHKDSVRVWCSWPYVI